MVGPADRFTGNVRVDSLLLRGEKAVSLLCKIEFVHAR